MVPGQIFYVSSENEAVVEKVSRPTLIGYVLDTEAPTSTVRHFESVTLKRVFRSFSSIRNGALYLSTKMLAEVSSQLDCSELISADLMKCFRANLNHSDKNIRWASGQLLGAVDEQLGLNALRKLADDFEPELRSTARKILFNIDEVRS
jgi:HEAT repeat protein